jgi:serine/threonine-protein kinase HipA
MVMEVVNVNFQEHSVGAVSFDTDKGTGAFEYSRDFIATGIELSPLHMPLAKRIYSFPEADYATFKGLPGLIADSLPDDFGNAVLNAWVAGQGLPTDTITPLQRLLYTGKRGMGALTYTPAIQMKNLNATQPVDIQSLVTIAQDILSEREHFNVALTPSGQADTEAMMSLLSVGTSAGGARPKAVLAFNDDFSQARSGQAVTPAGFTHYLMKFDGVNEHNKNQDTFGDPMGYGTMEYVYYLMARACDIDMMPSRLLDEGKRRHFITQRFDRAGNNKVHVQTLNGLAHVSFKQAGTYSYAQLLTLARKLKLSARDAEQIFRRMVFNVVARNHDDHAKNFAFMFNDKHQWQLAPAYDLAYSYKPGSRWVNNHWMSINGKRAGFVRADFYSFKQISPLFSKQKVDRIIDETVEQVSKWSVLAKDCDVPGTLTDLVTNNLRLSL